MDNDQYVSVMLVGLSDAGNKGLISPSEEKKLAGDVMNNKQADILAAQVCESAWDVLDIEEDVNYYGD